MSDQEGKSRSWGRQAADTPRSKLSPLDVERTTLEGSKAVLTVDVASSRRQTLLMQNVDNWRSCFVT